MLLGAQALGFPVVKVLSWIGGLPVEDFEDVVEGSGHKRAQQGTDPIDSMISQEGVVDHSGTEGSDRIDTGTGVENT